MTRPYASYLRPLIRVIVYVLVIVVLFKLSGRVDLRGFVQRMTGPTVADTTLVVAGSTLAPTLVDRVIGIYRQEYPKLGIHVGGGQTTAALEELVNKRADVAFLSRAPLPSEQKIFSRATGDTALWFPVALGAILVLADVGQRDTTVQLEDLRALASGRPAGGKERLYVPDPNSGLWDAFLAKAKLPPAGETPPPDVVFLKDDAAVADAVHADASALGLASSFALAEGPARHGARALWIRSDPAKRPMAPDAEDIASGEYPLWSYLYISCRPQGGAQGAKFVTYLTSQHGQRQIEHTEFLPVQQVMREIHLNRSPGPASPPGDEEGTG
jgi:ABC-type phosphate transport system substrate-binding protein